MKIAHLSVLTATALIMTCQSVNAESLFRPRAALGFAAYDLSMDAGTTNLASSSYMTLGIGATVAVDQVYFDLGVTNSLSATYDNEDTLTAEDFSRQDTALTIGLLLDGGVSVFGGYKTGSSEYSNVLGTGTPSIFDTDGLFAGASMSIPMDQNSLSLSGALAFMNGKWEVSDIGLNAEADTVGISMAMAYNMNFSDTNGLSLKAAYQYYSFTGWEDPVYIVADMAESIFSMDITFFANF